MSLKKKAQKTLFIVDSRENGASNDIYDTKAGLEEAIDEGNIDIDSGDKIYEVKILAEYEVGGLRRKDLDEEDIEAEDDE